MRPISLRAYSNAGAITLSTIATWIGVEIMLHLFTPIALQDHTYFFGFPGTPRYYTIASDSTQHLMYVTAPRSELAPDTFAVHKPDSVYRIFALGGSTTFGEPWGPPGAFARWLQARLNFFSHTTRFQVINAGHKGFGSFRVKTIFEELIEYSPNMVILYTGVNEMRDFEFHRHEIAIQSRPWLRALKSIADHSFVFRLGFAVSFKRRVSSYGADKTRTILRRQPGDFAAYETWRHRAAELNRLLRPELSVHPEAGSNGSACTDSARAQYRRMLELPWHPYLCNSFSQNVVDMVQECQSRGIKIILMTRARNLYNQSIWKYCFEQDDDASREILAAAQKFDVPVVNSMAAISAAVGEQIGYNAFVDDVHPALKSHQALARALFERVFAPELFDGNERDFSNREEAFQKYQDTLAASLVRSGSVIALEAWQDFIANYHALDEPLITQRIINKARAAQRTDPSDVHAYFLLGTLACARSDTTLAQEVWLALREQFPALTN